MALRIKKNVLFLGFHLDFLIPHVKKKKKIVDCDQDIDIFNPK